MYPEWFTECANLIWFVMDLDPEGLDGIWYHGNIYTKWLDQIMDYYEKIYKERGKEEDWKGAFVLDTWNDALVRAQKCLNEYATGMDVEEEDEEDEEEEEDEEGEIEE